MQPPPDFDRHGHCKVCKLDEFGIRYGERKAAELGDAAVMRSECGHVHAFRGGHGGPRNMFLEDQARKDNS